MLRAQNAVPMAQYDSLRTNANLAESVLNTTNVNVNQFGMLFTRTLDGYSYAHPLYVPNVSIPGVGLRNLIYAATLHNTVFAFDADDPAHSTPYWSVNLGSSIPFLADQLGGYVQPEMGIMSTPAIDLGTGTLYVVATTQQDSGAAMYLHALDIATGAEKFGAPVLIQATVSGSLTGYDRNPDGTITWNPNTRMQRSALLVANGIVYLGFATYGTYYPSHGWVMAYSASNVQNQIAVFNTTLNGQQGGVWQSGAGFAADSQGNVYLMSGNGTYNGSTDFGNSFIKLGPGLQVLDWFTPGNWSSLFQNDLDLGASGPVLVPNSNLLIGAGKQGVIYVLDSQNLGQLEGAGGAPPLQEFQATPACTAPTQCTEVHSTALWDASPNPRFYLWGPNDVMRGFSLAGNQFNTTPFSQSSLTSAYPGGGITVSSLGSTAGTGIVWATTAQSSSLITIVPGTLHAFDALDLTRELWNSNQNPSRDSMGNLAKFAEPVVANGRVYVPTFSNQLDVYGLLPSAPVGLSLISPANVAKGISLIPMLSWSAAAGATSYDVYFGTSPAPPFVTSTTATTYTLSTLTSNTTYYWQVVAKNAAGTTSSAIFSFTTFDSTCTFAAAPAGVLIGYAGGPASVSVTAGTGCAWTATSNASWLTITSGSSGTGNGTISFAGSSNVGTPQLAYITFANQRVGVMQGGSPSSQVFNDVPPSDPYFDYVSLMSTYGITAGCQASPPLYCPNTPVTRAQMAVFVVAGLNLALGTSLTYPPTAYFQDVPSTGAPDSIYFPFVQRIAQLGITAGCQASPAFYCPDESITQGQIAVFMIVAWMLANNLMTFTYPPTPYFTDVPSTDIYFKFVQKMAQLGFWTGCGGGSYCESSAVSRDQMAPMIMRAMMGAP